MVLIVRLRRALMIVLGGVALLMFLFRWSEEYIQAFHLEILRRGLEHHAHMVEMLYHVTHASGDSQLRDIREKISYDVTVIDHEGHVVADSLYSREELERLGNQLDLPEIVAAAEEGIGTSLRYNALTAGWFLYAAVPLSSGMGFVRLAMPVTGSAPRAE